MHQNCCESKDWGRFPILLWREKTATVNTELTEVSTTTKNLFLSPVYSLEGDSTIQGYQRVELLHCSAVHRMALSSAWIHARKKLVQREGIERMRRNQWTSFMFCGLYLSRRTAASWNVSAAKWSPAQCGEDEGNNLPLSRLRSNSPLDENPIFSDCQILKLCSQF